MTDRILIQFNEYEYYDPNWDREMLRFVATTDRGSYYANVANDIGKTRRERKQAFKDYVLEAIALKQPPHEIEMG